jgi:hypothetical protein
MSSIAGPSPRQFSRAFHEETSQSPAKPSSSYHAYDLDFPRPRERSGALKRTGCADAEPTTQP